MLRHHFARQTSHAVLDQLLSVAQIDRNASLLDDLHPALIGLLESVRYLCGMESLFKQLLTSEQEGPSHHNDGRGAVTCLHILSLGNLNELDYSRSYHAGYRMDDLQFLQNSSAVVRNEHLSIALLNLK